MKIEKGKLIPLPITELAYTLRELTRLREGRSRWSLGVDPKQTQEELATMFKTLSRDLGVLDLGVMWDDSNECYVVYDLDSIKE